MNLIKHVPKSNEFLMRRKQTGQGTQGLLDDLGRDFVRCRASTPDEMVSH
jgi:hypothetical protein